jgi:hypothetical protein
LAKLDGSAALRAAIGDMWIAQHLYKIMLLNQSKQEAEIGASTTKAIFAPRQAERLTKARSSDDGSFNLVLFIIQPLKAIAPSLLLR